MKKLMVAAAIVCAAVAVKASTVSWGLTTALDATKFESGNIYLFAGSTIADISTWANAQTSYTFDSVKAQLGGDLAVLNTAPNTITLADGMGSSMGNSVTTYGDSKTGNYSVYIVAISEDGKNLALAKSAKTLNIRNVASPAQATYMATDMNVFSAVPEPTSGLLLLLGVAGLALRRRRA